MAKGAILLGTAHNFKKNSEGAMNGWMDVIQCAEVKVIHPCLNDTCHHEWTTRRTRLSTFLGGNSR